jgi:CheY-like chemotaxis protein
MQYDSQYDSLHILLADDDEDDRLFFKDAIEAVKVRTVLEMVNDGQQLMDYLNRDGVVLPHVIFLDLNMPRKSGMECLEEIRRDDKLKEIPVAIYSTSSSEKDIHDTLVKGANIYITKPNDFQKLKKVISQVISINWQYHTSGMNKEHFLMVV